VHRSSVRAVCFDLDGTLFDDRQYARAGLERGAAELERRSGVDLTAELLSAYFDRGIRAATFDVVLSEAGLPADHVPALVTAYHDGDGALVPYPDAEATLAALSADYGIGVLTGGTGGHEKLTRLGLDTHVDECLVTAERDDSKRDADPFVELAARLGAAHESVVYVGDRPELDFPQPNRLGMTTIRLRRGHYATVAASGDAVPDIDVDTLRGVRDAVARLGR